MTKRILKVNELIKREISQILLKEVEFPKEILVTVTRVETSVDLNQVKVFLSVMSAPDGNKVSETGAKKQATNILQILNRQIYDIQQMLNKRLKMRPIPRIRFVEEKKTEEAGRIEEILEKIKRGVEKEEKITKIRKRQRRGSQVV